MYLLQEPFFQRNLLSPHDALLILHVFLSQLPGLGQSENQPDIPDDSGDCGTAGKSEHLIYL